jgi:hypothetical protein
MSAYVGEMVLLSNHIDAMIVAPWYVWVMFPFATVMGARTIAVYGVMSWFRRPFTNEIADSCYAGMNVEPKRGLAYPWGWLIGCPICSGTHFGTALLLLYCLNQRLGLAFLLGLSVAAASFMLHYLSEKLSWGARRDRVLAGLISPDPGTIGYETKMALIKKLLEKESK